MVSPAQNAVRKRSAKNSPSLAQQSPLKKSSKRQKSKNEDPDVSSSKLEKEFEFTFNNNYKFAKLPSPEYKYQLALYFVTALAFISRFYSISYPDEVVFDEVHFGKFASYYLERTYFFDLHPPFAKLLIAGVGYLIGYSGKFKFTSIGDSYIENNVPYIAYRSFSALLGSLTIPVIFLTMKESNYSIPSCLLASCLVLFDNAHVAETRLILLDSTLIFSVALSIYCYVKFSKQRSKPFSFDWYKWLALTGVSLSCVISTKYVGVFTFMTIGSAVLIDLWDLLDIKKGLSIEKFAKHFLTRFLFLIVIPFFIYLFWFWCHFAILTKSGPGDSFMSSDFQETLGDSPLARDAKQVNFYDVITIKHKDTEGFLHSHPYEYPLRYEDGRVSSKGQQVTCVKSANASDDSNNLWQILPKEDFPENKRVGHPVRISDVIRLYHLNTDSYLLTHDVASPLFPTNEEFTTVKEDLALGKRYNDTLFRIGGAEKKKTGIVKTKASLINILHVPTVVAMWTHDDKLLPDWGFNQQEVNGNKKLKEHSNAWVFDEIFGLNDSRSVYVPKKIKRMPFLSKWFELQKQMFVQNNKLTSQHPFASQPESWLLSLSGVSFWSKNSTREQIYFIGNILAWAIEACFLSVFIGIVLADQITRRREVFALSEDSRSRLYYNIGFFFIGWCSHYFPFFLMGRQKFLHHYLPAHLIASEFTGALFEFIFTDNRGEGLLDDKELKEFKNNKRVKNSDKNQKTVYKINKYLFVVSFAILVTSVIATFMFFKPLTYGNESLDKEQVLARQWLNIKLHFAK
ncbi:dolichyl-phosphate-mannose-protein mannosyltransferase [Ascoidea rubescens DSM 1968]|uniref:Dolichyl-phosphate-mannose--protein mannosyltransferase n=1 Tax=Ascoidea rubescens DSM 1968 TaxID=1344418 RepID=A0A1D2VNL6_9ASCO|nr:glycosyltransferase family 39 protein [Ascoidea rubescens DSM 1968]ODV63189.1 glycosyltransferase family 39 protein [Ascoidea rubescens DSM 1968]